MIALRVVASDLPDLRDESPAGPPLDLDEQVERISDVAFDGTVWQVHLALQDARRKATQSLVRGIGVDRRKGA